ncbi:MAG: OmpA family protein [Deltaproteobacteria bacterium]|nr:OmpA family protein [Deltaproteobacteria bacterium]
MIKRLFPTVAVVVLTISAAGARAEVTGFALDRFTPSEAGSDWFTQESLDLRGQVRPFASFVLDEGHRPLALYSTDGSASRAVVANQLYGHLSGAMTLVDRIRVGLSVPLALFQNGEAVSLSSGRYAPPRSGAFGDIRLGADVRLYGVHGDALTLAAGARAFIPTGSRDNYSGDGAVRLEPRALAAGEIGLLAWAAQLGFQYRALSEGFASAKLGSEMLLGASLGWRFWDRRLLIGPELYGRTLVNDFLGRTGTPLEAILGAQYFHSSGISIGLAGGMGLTRGFGSPESRWLARISWAEPPESAPGAVPVLDRDFDGSVDAEDACPDVAGLRSEDPKKNGCPPDRDGDAVADSQDACPDLAGLRSEDPKKNGCPPDRDGDAIADVQDACPDAPGVSNGDPNKNGCPPEKDQDADTIADAEDACPEVPGLGSEDPKINGCPPDKDGDAIADAEDACPEVPGVRNEDPKINGCPSDTDRDAVADSIDTCRDVPGVPSADLLKNGCPKDSDDDSFTDAEDACPMVVGVFTVDPRLLGCPIDPDRDRDRIANEKDACPDEPGAARKDPKKNGCPKAFVQGNAIKILDQVKFKTLSAEILPGKDSVEVLNAVLQVFKEHPTIKRVRVEGHTDDVGKPGLNKELSGKRAATVVKWLVDHGIAQERLTSEGFGLERPIDSNKTAAGRANNRRVEFQIVEQMHEEEDEP